MPPIRRNSTAWNKKSVVFVHGVGTSQPGYSEPLIDVLSAADAALAGATRWYEVAYDFVNTAMAQKVVLIQETLQSRAVELEGFMETHVLDVLTFLCLEDTRNWVTTVMERALVDVVKDGHDDGVMQEEHEVSIIAHSLGTMVTYETLHKVVDSAEALGCSQGFRVKTLFTLGSPLAFVRWSRGKIPHLGQGSVIFRQDIARPARVNRATRVTETNLGAWHNYRHELDPIASLMPLKRGAPEAVNVPDSDSVFNRLNDGLNPHSFKNYVTEYADDILKKI